MAIRVRAIDVGYIDHIFRRKGDEFVIPNEKVFSSRWMQKLDPDVEPVRASAAPVAKGKPAAKVKVKAKEEPVVPVTGDKDVL